ncbi:MAG: polysaccharide deacetylase family protein [Dictyoglomus sp.]|nr:polysaccharide deacetylase family protein [Dictyoglomus sp.]MCX7942638.1 polysaccharide deacetylase family protein [Dictyoglomaceae bacterium]MDW8188899.1 polysaccharide deacetylase family protein [Dictyoglomus sp.]
MIAINNPQEIKEKFLIISADDFGMCHSVNIAIFKLLEEKIISSTTIMTPCPWAKEAGEFCKAHPEFDVGVHLTFTSEWRNYKWGPVTRNKSVESLVNREGYFFETSEEFERHAKEEEIEEEIRNQINLAFKLGVKPSHLDSHMGSLFGFSGRTFIPIVFQFCKAYNLPFRLPKKIPPEMLPQLSQDLIDLHMKILDMAREMGIPLIDYLIPYPYDLPECSDYYSFKRMIIGLLKKLRPGISEIIIHPSVESDEIKSINPTWEKRVWEYLVFRDEEVRRVIKEEGIKIISWKDLKL